MKINLLKGKMAERGIDGIRMSATDWKSTKLYV